MGGFFGAALRTDCVFDLFYGTDYHSHLGTVSVNYHNLVVRIAGFSAYFVDMTPAMQEDIISRAEHTI